MVNPPQSFLAPDVGHEEFEKRIAIGRGNGQNMDGTMLESGIIVGNFGCCDCGEGTRGGLCVNCALFFSVVMTLFLFWCRELFFF